MELSRDFLVESIENWNWDLFEKLSNCIVDYFDNNGSGEDYPMTNYDLEYYIDTLSPMDAFELGKNSDFYWNDEIFIFDGYGNIKSYSSWLSYFRSEIDLEDFSNWYNKECEEEENE